MPRGWRTGVKGRDVVTSRILPGIFFKKAVTRVVTGRDAGRGLKTAVEIRNPEVEGRKKPEIRNPNWRKEQ
jgi:hypothetical protein